MRYDQACRKTSKSEEPPGIKMNEATLQDAELNKKRKAKILS